MRILDRIKISYEYQTYECDNFTDGISTADTLGLPHERVYKTLVTTGKSGSHYVFVIPIEAELDLKKAARAVGEKSVEMLPVREITTHHILKILQETAKRGAPTVAAEARRTISSVFELAVATLRADSDPVWPVRKALPANKTQHKQALNPQQIGKLLSCFDNSRGSYQVNYCMWLMWWTLARPAEATEAEWTEFNLDNALWTIPAARMKARREHVIPLPFQAVKMLRTLQGLTGHRQHLFPGRDNPLGPMTSHSLRQLLKSLGWSGTYSPHATRTTGSTRLNELGYRPDAIEAQLAHADTNNVRRTYNHATYLDERKVMMQEWADMLDKWVAGFK